MDIQGKLEGTISLAKKGDFLPNHPNGGRKRMQYK
jgi:hypothetical protein